MPVSSPNFPEAGFNHFGLILTPSSAFTGGAQTSSGDISGFGNFLAIRSMAQLSWWACAYLETLLEESRRNDALTGLVAQSVTTLVESVNGLHNAVNSVNTTVVEIRTRQEELIAALGLVQLPGWLTLEEVLHGDDMGLERPSADSLGLVVDYFLQGDQGWTLQQGPPDEEWLTVVSTTPSAGAVVKEGATIKVFLAP